VQTLKEELSIPDTDYHRWGVASNEESNSQFATSVPMSTGVVEGDPLALVLLNAPDPAELTQLLVSVGYAAAKTPTDFPVDESDPIEKIDLLAYTIMIEGTKLEASTLVVATEIYNVGLGGSLATITTPISIRPSAPPSDWGLSVCGLFEIRLCQFQNSCHIKRTQSYNHKRTLSCFIGGVATYCDQTKTETCTETQSCPSITIPGRTGGNASCVPPDPPYPMPDFLPCRGSAPNVPRTGALRDCASGGWTPTNGVCPCLIF